MSTAQTGADPAVDDVPATDVDMKLEVVVIPVTDVDRARDFYVKLGWRVDADVHRDEFRLVQLTPPGSGCSVQFGTDLTSAAPGSAQWVYLVVSDIKSASDALAGRGATVSEVFHEAALGDRFHDKAWAGGPAAGGGSYGSFASFSDPDGNTWLLQEVTRRLPGRTDATTTSFTSAADLEAAFRRAAAAHGQHEQRLGQADPNWPQWYADYMVAEQRGGELPS
jgi:catechol 2,3-dioxygenase-like lactoylglutathione lyase family enzyme